MKNQYFRYIEDALGTVITEGRYRTFANITRSCGDFPYATFFDGFGVEKKITVWCSNDYLGMGQNKVVIESIKNT